MEVSSGGGGEGLGQGELQKGNVSRWGPALMTDEVHASFFLC